MPIRIPQLLAAVWLLSTFVSQTSVQAGDKSIECRTPYRIFGHKAEIDPRHEEPKCLEQRFAQAGHPHCISPLADWSNTSKYWGYYVGGGNPFRFGGKRLAAEHRYTRCEGTWGWDYVPWYSSVRLGWWHGRKYQDGEGQYKATAPVEPFSPGHGPKGIIMNGLIH